MSGKPRYFRFLTDQVGGEEVNGKSYEKLLLALYNREFYFSVEMDSNRVADAFDFRRMFEYDTDSSVRGDYPKVLEVLVALACRCEFNIMGDSKYGNRVPTWFWSMIESMDILEFDDCNYDDEAVQHAISVMLDREYSRDGKGGLFYIPRSRRDLRKAEIWYQMCWWLDSKYSSNIENEEG